MLEIGGVESPEQRFKVVVPENYHRFPPHFSLATLLLYSPRALRRISAFCRGRAAYIVPGAVTLGCMPQRARESSKQAVIRQHRRRWARRYAAVAGAKDAIVWAGATTRARVWVQVGGATYFSSGAGQRTARCA